MHLAIRNFGLLLITCGLLGCGGSDDNSSGETRIDSVQIRAANADGTEVDLTANINYTLSEDDAYLKIASNNSGSAQDYDEARLISAGSNNIELTTTRRVSVNDDSTATVNVWMNDSLGQYKEDGFGFSEAKINLAFPTDMSRQATQLTKVQLELVPNSYTVTFNQAYRSNEHTFRFKVLDQNGLAVSGLENRFNDYFSIRENGSSASNETINQTTAQSEVLSCYFVIDASYSIQKAKSEPAVRAAVSKLVISLAPVSRLFYKQFATEVKTLESVRDLRFEELDRFTSLYSGIDQALSEIAENKDNSQKVMIVFTDGEDNYSQNYYPNLNVPNLATSEQVYTYLTNRISTIQPTVSGGLAIYTIGLGNNINVDKLTALAALGKGAFVKATDENALNDKFSEIYRLIKSNYSLSYLSPNLGQVNQLVLEANINGANTTLNIVGTD